MDLIAIIPFYVELLDPPVVCTFHPTTAILMLVANKRVCNTEDCAIGSCVLVSKVCRVLFELGCMYSSPLSAISNIWQMIGETFRRSGEAMVMLAFLLSITTMVYPHCLLDCV